jgi:hypothetical protein
MQQQRPTPFPHPFAYGLLVGFAIFIFGGLIEMLLHGRGISFRWDLIDNLITGILTGLIVFLYEQRRGKDIRQRLRMIAAMNHHVRNALQSILWSPYAEDSKEQIRKVQDSVYRIEWALREILPSKSDDTPGLLPPEQPPSR